MRRVRVRRVSMVAFVVLALLLIPLLAACSSDEATTTTAAATGTTAASTETTAGTSETTPPAASGESFVYRLATGSPEMDNAVTEEFKEWAANVEKASNGRLKIEIFFGGALGDSKDALAMLESGVADMVMEGYGFFSDTFPVSDVITLPYLVGSTAGCATLMNGMLADGLLPEYDDIKLLTFLPRDPIMMFFRDKNVQTLEDLQGLKIRTNSAGWSTFVEALGAVPTQVATPELYTALDTGVIDGLVTSLGFFHPMGLGEVCKYALVEPMGMSMNFVAMSWDAWNQLPADLQLVLTQVTQDYSWNNVYNESDRYLNAYLKPVEEAGVEILHLTPDELARWESETSFMVSDWTAKVDGQGLAGSEAVRRANVLGEVLQ